MIIKPLNKRLAMHFVRCLAFLKKGVLILFKIKIIIKKIKMKNILQINGVMSKDDATEISDELVEFIQDKILMMLNEQGFMFADSWKHQTEGDFIDDLSKQII